MSPINAPLGICSTSLKRLRYESLQHVARFHCGQRMRGVSPLFALQALANSRETQHFSKASGLSRVEHSPNLELLRSSEVDPFKQKHPQSPLVQTSSQSPDLPISTPAIKAASRRSVPLPKAGLASSAASLSSTNAQQNYGRMSEQSAPTTDALESRSTQDALLRLERKYGDLNAAWLRDRKVLSRQIRRYALLLATICILSSGFAAWTSLSLMFERFQERKLKETPAPTRMVDREAMRITATNAMSGTKRSSSSSVQSAKDQPEMLPAVEATAAPPKAAATTTGWFWRH